ncbi:MgtC/SapB family protein [Leptolyngbya sp. FACHB-711]|uniref:MgtC/SapB family protein n=1 Tax=unclassified Leptolyngbya TaxID=2650499 RepID=UPI0016892533|nr:MgtC/SapB family protein [Leptolyngbya sp. FACHB-711]MBD1849988.1 MgtC/SapB family protein [Cyanobacteria bacterium FACHB-502]MBD2027483.1 MgtC/SapB family protein [Leptolyngbya sp. FACHB-711]
MQEIAATSSLLPYPPLSFLELLFRLAIALILGAIVGIERQIRHKSAGLRTYMLVSLGTAFLVLVPIQAGVAQESIEAVSRLLQGIITGVGFIGGGTILHHGGRNGSKDEVRAQGLTSAAAIWVCSGLGLAAAFGLWQMGLVGAVLTWFILDIVKRIEPHIDP